MEVLGENRPKYLDLSLEQENLFSHIENTIKVPEPSSRDFFDPIRKLGKASFLTWELLEYKLTNINTVVILLFALIS